MCSALRWDEWRRDVRPVWQMRSPDRRDGEWAEWVERNEKQIYVCSNETGGTINTINKRCTFRITHNHSSEKRLHGGRAPETINIIINVERLLALQRYGFRLNQQQNERKANWECTTCLMSEGGGGQPAVRSLPVWAPINPDVKNTFRSKRGPIDVRSATANLLHSHQCDWPGCWPRLQMLQLQLSLGFLLKNIQYLSFASLLIIVARCILFRAQFLCWTNKCSVHTARCTNTHYIQASEWMRKWAGDWRGADALAADADACVMPILFFNLNFPLFFVVARSPSPTPSKMFLYLFAQSTALKRKRISVKRAKRREKKETSGTALYNVQCTQQWIGRK